MQFKLLIIVTFIVSSLFAGHVYAGDRDTAVTVRRDTGKIKSYYVTNRAFGNIYLQNLRQSYTGQEFFDPKKTLLTGDLTANFVLLNTAKLPIFLVAYSRVNLRLFSAQGSPVKSPSYMPGFAFYFRVNGDVYHPEFFSLSYTHHSNGIRGPSLNPNGTFNVDSGKFTTNFYTLTYHTGKRTGKDNLIINRYDALGIELHAGLFGKGYSAGLPGHYGFVRVNGEWIYNIARATPDAVDNSKKTFQNWQRIQINLTYIADKYDNYNSFDLKKRLNLYLKYYYQFPFMQNVSLVAGGGYRGQDEYNVYFQDSYAYALFGVAMNISFNTHGN